MSYRGRITHSLLICVYDYILHVRPYFYMTTICVRTCIEINVVFCLPDTNMCRNDPCENGGTCRNLINGSLCQCVDGFSGQHCEKREFASAMIY